MKIRKAQLQDCELAADIYNNYLGTATMDLDKKEGSFFHHYIENEADREEMYIAEINGKIIGYSVIKKYSPKLGYQYACETSTFFHPDYINKGYGSTFKKFILEKCKQLDYKNIVARIFASNSRSIEYNLKLGYTMVGIQKNIGYVNGKWEDVAVMEYLIK